MALQIVAGIYYSTKVWARNLRPFATFKDQVALPYLTVSPLTLTVSPMNMAKKIAKAPSV